MLVKKGRLRLAHSPLSIPAKAGISLFAGASNARTASFFTIRGWGDSRFRGNGNSFFDKKEFLPSAACGGGCEREAVAGGGERAMMGGISPPPKNSLARIFTPPRKRRRVRQSAISLIPAPSFHSLPLFHSCVGRNLCGDSRIRRQATMQCSASRKILAVARMRFRLSPEWKEGGGTSLFRSWQRRQRWGNKFPRKFRTIINYGAKQRNVITPRSPAPRCE